MALAAVLILVALDQFSKAWMEQCLADKAIKVIPGFFNLELTWNSGAAWNFLANKSWGIVFLSLVSLVVSVIVLFYLDQAGSFRAKLVLVLIAAGGIGNLIDRIRFRKVTDFLAFSFGSYKFPVFNLADICVTVGVGLALLFILRNRHFLDELAGHVPLDPGDAM